MMNIPKYIAYIAVLGLCVQACTSDKSADKKTSTAAAPVNKLTEPLRFHRAIEIKPGLTFDVVSWGRGAEKSGGYLILRSDSTKGNYKSVAGEREGEVVDAWNMDMDNDGNPEIYIQCLSKNEDKTKQFHLYVQEFSGTNAQVIKFPDLSGNLKKGYQGQDSLYIKEGKLYRTFPVVATSSDTTKKAEVSKRVIEYDIRGNSFVATEIKEKVEKPKTEKEKTDKPKSK